MRHYQSGHLSQAESIFKEIIQLRAGHPGALHFLGIISHRRGDNEIAIKLINKAIRTNAFNPAFYNSIGNIYMAMNKHEEALDSYRNATRLKPDYAGAHYNIGNIFKVQSKHDQAIACYQKTLSLCPEFFDAHLGLGNVFLGQGKHDEAIACYQKGLLLKPDLIEARYNLGNIFLEQGKYAQALVCYQKVLSLKPESAETYSNLGKTYSGQGQHDQALACYQKALSLKPDFIEARWALTKAQIPIVYGSDDNPAECRHGFSRELAVLERWLDTNQIESGYSIVGNNPPFYLAYQEENNRDLLSRHGELCVRLMEDWWVKQRFPYTDPAQDGIIRIGLVSEQIRDHSVWNALIKGWFQHLDRGRFQLHVFHTGTVQDKETAWARTHSTSFSQGRKELHQWVEDILDKQPTVLIYPEIGMDPMTAKLASLRLAPVQVASWGHPETTGLPTIDYFLSAEDFEPPGAQDNYTERLVSLPHLGCCYYPLMVDATEPDLSGMGIDSKLPIFLCPGTPFKYTPQYDRIFIEISRRVGRCQFIFFTHRFRELSDKLRQRLQRVFEQAHMDFSNYCVFIPWQNSSVYYGLMKRADVVLDTIGFSGFNTAMKAIECGLPIVTREGRFMRGRLSSGILRRMRLTELIAANEDEYIALAVRLVQDAGYRQRIRQHIEAVREDLYGDLMPVRALEEFLINVATNK